MTLSLCISNLQHAQYLRPSVRPKTPAIFRFSRWWPSAILDLLCLCLNHPRRGFGDLCRCAIFSERELMFTFAICYRPSVCRLSVVCNVRAPYLIFGNISTALGTMAIRWHPPKILRRSSQGNPPSGELNTTGVAKYSDFRPIEGHISETVQYRR